MEAPNFGSDWSADIDRVEPHDDVQDGKYAPKWPFRMLISGASGSGKTFTLVSMLMGDNPDAHVSAEEIHICSKTLDEPAYKIIKEGIDRAEDELHRIMKEEGHIGPNEQRHKIGYWYTDPSELIGYLDNIENGDKTRRLFVFDDQELNQAGAQGKTMESFFQRARKFNISTVFIAQTLYGTSKFIRRNCQYKIIFAPSSRREINLMTQDTPFEKKDFIALAKSAWDKPRGWIMIDKDNRLRLGFGPPAL